MEYDTFLADVEPLANEQEFSYTISILLFCFFIGFQVSLYTLKFRPVALLLTEFIILLHIYCGYVIGKASAH